VRCDTSQDNITALRIEWSRYLAAWEQSGRKDADALLNLGNAYKILGRADESLKCFMLALRLQPMRLDIWILGVSVYAELGRLDDAAATFRAVLDAIPASVPRISEIVSIYSILLTNLANCSEAVARLRAQPRDQQSDLVADLIMCQAQRVCGDFDAAAQTSTSLRQRLSQWAPVSASLRPFYRLNKLALPSFSMFGDKASFALLQQEISDSHEWFPESVFATIVLTLKYTL
jgi:tetratricopeptide (TPR) repeat protein